MGRHSKRALYVGLGRHRTVPPKRNVAKTAVVVLPLTASMVLFPAFAGDDTGFYHVPGLGGVIPILNAPEAAAEEVIIDPTDVVDPPVVDLHSPAS